MHEAKLHSENSFLTLTYSPERLPPFGSLVVKDFQDFMKRLRFHFSERTIRFFHCGEYGDRNRRPHYHAIIFNLDFADKYRWKTVNGFDYHRSPTLEKLWTLGNSTIGAVTFESAAYVARYITKKVNGKKALYHYAAGFDEKTGEYVDLKPEYVTMSRRPGIGKGFYEKFKGDFYPDDFVLVERGDRLVKSKVPRFYDAMLEVEDPHAFAKVQAMRKVGAAAHADNNTRDRLEVREIVLEERFRRLKRSFESESE